MSSDKSNILITIDGISFLIETDKIYREEILDNVQKEIFVFLSNLVSGQVPHELTKKAHMQMRIADEYESVSDYIMNILKLHLKLSDANIVLTDMKKTEICKLHDEVTSYFDMINTLLYNRQPVDMSKIYTQGNAITHHFKKLRSNHLQRLSEKKMEPLLSVSYINMLNSYRTIKDYIQNVAEVMAEKF